MISVLSIGKSHNVARMARKRRASSILRSIGQQPKSDYTYSESLTYRDRVTPDRKIGSPNMSRRGLKGGSTTKYIKSQNFSSSLDTSGDSSQLNLRSRTIHRPMDSLSDTSDVDDVVEPLPPPILRRYSRSRSRSRSRSVDILPQVNGGAISRTFTTTNTITTTRTLHQGLDVDSDDDDDDVILESALPLRATPLTAGSRPSTPLTTNSRPATPLDQARTPLPRSVTPVSFMENTHRGYLLKEGAIAEEVEGEGEDIEKLPKSRVVTWSRQTWQRVQTIITTSLVTFLTRVVSGRQQSHEEASLSRKSLKTSFFSSVTQTTHRASTATANFLSSTRERLKRNPILLWIPLLFILLLLSLVAYWWLLQSRAKTDDSTTDPKEGTSFLSLAITSASELTLSVINGISHAAHSSALGMTSWLLAAWDSLLGVASGLLGICSACLYTAWVYTASMFSWLGALINSGLSHLFHLLYLTFSLLQYLALAVLGLITSCLSYMSGFFLPLIATNNTTTTTTSNQATTTQSTLTEDTAEGQSETWSIVRWFSNAASLHWVSDVNAIISEQAGYTQNWLWSGWMWLVLSVAHVLTTIATFILWFLGSLWSLLSYLVLGLWTVLANIFMGIIGFFTSTATTVTTLAVGTSSSVARNTKLIFLPFFKTSKEEMVDVHAIGSEGKVSEYKAVSVEEVLNRVLNSAELRALVTTLVIDNSKGHMTHDQVSSLIKSVMEGELGKLKADVVALESSFDTKTRTAADDASVHMKVLSTKQENLHQQLDMLGLGLSKLEGSLGKNQEAAESLHTGYQEQLLTLRTRIDRLTAHINELKINQSSLAQEMKQCCQNASVMRSDIERHVTSLLGDVFGWGGEGAVGSGRKRTTEDMAAWLKSYFVAKDQLEEQLNTLLASMHISSASAKESEETAEAREAAVAQTTQVVMDTVLEKLREELHQHYAHAADSIQEQVAQQVNVQVEEAAAVLSRHVTTQLEQQLLSSRHQLQATVIEAVIGNIPSYVDSVLGEAVANAVSETLSVEVVKAVAAQLPASVDVAVTGAVPQAVAAAVSAAIAKAVPEEVKVAVIKAVAEAVPPKSDESVLSATVMQVVQEAVVSEVQGAVAEAVPQVVASVLPSLVNESVATAVSEAQIKSTLLKTDIVKSVGEGDVVGEYSAHTVSTTVNISQNTTSSNGSGLGSFSVGLNESAVIQIVKEALLKYDADKTGMVDHALESAGGNIISTRCTENYEDHKAAISILGFTYSVYPTNNPRTIIQPERNPGQCWAFKGSQGYIVMQLAGPVWPSGFTLEHIPKTLSPSGEISSAPKNFEVWGLEKINDEGVLLGKYEYDQNGDPLQYFPVANKTTEYFPLIELKVSSNHGNLHYTCIYRFRVHGIRHF